MANPLRQLDDSRLNDDIIQEIPKFQTFDELNLNTSDIDFEELAFFAQLLVFCILTVMLSFLFLAIKLSAFFALPLAIASSLLTVYSVKELLVNHCNK
ncbi:DUF3270 family protein [Streptococcus sp. E17BB]|uniref:DUF3270 family protein n=1 Tax=Streptococcus sp. E17BB TaxID=3278714 RepID=UPI00359E2418